MGRDKVLAIVVKDRTGKGRLGCGKGKLLAIGAWEKVRERRWLTGNGNEKSIGCQATGKEVKNCDFGCPIGLAYGG